MLSEIVIALLVLYLLLGEPLLGRRQHRRMLAALADGEAGARLRFFSQWTWQAWLLAVVTVAIAFGLAGWPPARMGFALPHWMTSMPALPSSMLAGFVAGVVLAGGGGFVFAAIAHRRAKPGRPRGMTANPQISAMLPRTRGERRAWVALAVTAGITEEIVWRGFGLSLLFALLPGVHPAVPIAIAAAAFGWAHLYQGAAGIVATGVLGGVFALLFWSSGSLLLPMILHVLIDLRILLIRVPASTVIGEQA